MKSNGLFIRVVLLLASGISIVRAAETDQGKQIYIQYCASCHGKDAQGNGPVSPYLKIKAPDLTLIRKKHQGIYPLSKVMSAIDGSHAVRAHGNREMPVWGEIFEKKQSRQNTPSLRRSLRAS